MTDEVFSNQQVDIYSLPKVDDVAYKRVHKEHLNVQLISSAIFWGIVVIGAILWLTLNTVDYPLWADLGGGAVILSLIGLSLFFTIKLHYRMGYALREQDVLFKAGFLWRSETVIPFKRIQHVEVEQGPIDRLFDLSQVKVYTAGGSSSDLVIPGLRPTEAESIKFFILNRSTSDEEE